jgi:hypothetical protein
MKHQHASPTAQYIVDICNKDTNLKSEVIRALTGRRRRDQTNNNKYTPEARRVRNLMVLSGAGDAEIIAEVKRLCFIDGVTIDAKKLKNTLYVMRNNVKHGRPMISGGKK